MGTNTASMRLSDSRKSNGKESEQRLLLGFNIQIALQETISCPRFLYMPFFTLQSLSSKKDTSTVSQFAPILSFSWLSSDYNETSNSASFLSLTVL